MKHLRIIILALLLPAFAFATPNDPSNLTFTNVTSHSVILNWEDNSEDETGFKILVNGKYLLKTAPDVTHFTIGSLIPNREYEFTVKSTDFNDEHHKATISTDSQTYNENEDIVVHLKNLIRDDANNWVGIYPKDAPNDWDNKIKWERPKEGKTNVTLPGIAAGEYEARLFYSSSFELLAKVSFSVKADEVSISTNKRIYNVNEKIITKFRNLGRDDNNNWVGIYPKDASNDWDNKISWNRPLGQTTLTFDGIAAGEYEARLFYSDKFILLAKVGFSVGNDDLNRIYPPEVALERKKADDVNRPAEKLSSYIDNSFDNSVKRTVTRITNREEDDKGFNGHQYPKHGSAWNSDMSLLRLVGRLYDAEELIELPLTKTKLGREVDELMKKPISGSAGIRWSKDNPYVLYVMSGDNKFYKLTIVNNKTEIKYEVIYDCNKLGKGQFTIGHGEGNLDYADRYVVLSATSENSIYAVLLDTKTKELVWGPEPKKLKYPEKIKIGDKYKSDFDWISISPNGKYILVSSNVYNEGKGSIDLHDALTFNIIKRLTKHSAHGDIGKTSNNEDIYVQWEYNKYYGYILNDNPHDEEPIKLLDRSGGSAHVSCRNYNLKNWCYISSSNNGYREVFALKLDGSMKVRRFAKTHAKGSEDDNSGDDTHPYYDEMPAGIPSPDGTKVLFWSDYGNPDLRPYFKEEGSDLDAHYYWDRRDTYQVKITK